MKLFSLMGNSQHLDGGAMFGNVPRTLWTQWLTPDEFNRIQLACRCLLIQDKGKNILLETGIGAFFEPMLKERFGVVEPDHVLLSSLGKIGIPHTAIDIVILSHLHFDHAGGLLSPWSPLEPVSLLFPNADYVVSKKAWERANAPHPRDKASFIPLLNKLLTESNRLKFVDNDLNFLGSNFSFHMSDGHTPGMLLTEINTLKGPLVFAADLIPGLPWVHLPVTMGYDRFPEMVINEKQELLHYLANHNGALFFTHDPSVASAKIKLNDANKFVSDDICTAINQQFWS